jgi:hypothetical protein
VVDPFRLGTTSEGQASALLRAVYMDDRTTFDRLWMWTKANLQIPEDGLLASRWNTEQDGTVTLEWQTDTGADQQVALALLFARQRWDDSAYEQEALPLLRGIWDRETVILGGRRVVVAGDWARGDVPGGVLYPVISPSYFAPYAYRIFAVADPARPWMELVDSSYDVLAELQANPRTGGHAGAVPDWATLDHYRRAIGPTTPPGLSVGHYSTDAAKVPSWFSLDRLWAAKVSWWLTLDWLWFEEGRAHAAIEALSLPREELERHGRLFSAYYLNGIPVMDDTGDPDEAIWMYAVNLGNLLVAGDSNLAHRVYGRSIAGQYTAGAEGAYWGQPSNPQDQTWGWFATALMDGGLANLWADDRVIDWETVLPGG